MSKIDGEFGPDTRVFGDPSESSRDEIVENALSWMSHGAEYSKKEAEQEYGEWFVERLDEHEELTYSEFYKTWAKY